MDEWGIDPGLAYLREHSLEAGKLIVGVFLVLVSDGQVGVHTGDGDVRQAQDFGNDLARILLGNAHASHAGIDGEMDRHAFPVTEGGIGRRLFER